jgi:hypothetical protein
MLTLSTAIWLANLNLSGFTLHFWLSIAEALVSLYVLSVLAMSAWKRSRLLSKSKASTWPAMPVRSETPALLSLAAKLSSKFSTIRTRTRGAAQWSTVLFMAVVCGGLVYLGTRPAPPITYSCPQSCLGIVKVEGPNAIETVNLQTSEHREWRFIANPPITRGSVFPGYVIEIRVRETPVGAELDEPSSDPPYHIVRGKDVAQPAYAPVAGVTYEDGPDRPVLARNCRNTLDDRDVVCEGGDAQFERQLTQR